MEIKINAEEHHFLAKEIACRFNDKEIKVELNGVELFITYKLDKLGYIEEDTGAFVCTDIEFDLTDISVMNIDAELLYSEWTINKDLRKLLID